MRNTVIALAATAGVIALGATGASAASRAPVQTPPQASSVQQVDWYCGPRCHYYRQQRWAARNYYRQQYRPYYGYNYNYGYQNPPYYYR